MILFARLMRRSGRTSVAERRRIPSRMTPNGPGRHTHRGALRCAPLRSRTILPDLTAKSRSFAPRKVCALRKVSRAPEGLRGHSAPERLDLDLGFDEPQRSPYDAPAGARSPARPHSNVPGAPDLSPRMAFEEVAKERPVDLDAAASLQPAHPSSEPRDEVMNDRELDRLEASLRWLQRQEATTRLPRGEPLAPVRGLPPPVEARDRPPIDARDRHPVDPRNRPAPARLLPTRETVIPAATCPACGRRSRSSPQRMAPPPRGSRHDSLRWPLRILIASSVAAPVLYYLSIGWGPAPEPAAANCRRHSDKRRSADCRAVVRAQKPKGAVAGQGARRRASNVGRARRNSAAACHCSATAEQGLAAASAATAEQGRSRQRASNQRSSRRSRSRGRNRSRPRAAPSPARPPARTLGSDDIALLIKQGEQFIASGDVVTARIVFLRAAEAGDPNAAVALGATYDPTVLARLGVVGMAADVEKARSWYQKAESLGSPEASRRLRISRQPLDHDPIGLIGSGWLFG